MKVKKIKKSLLAVSFLIFSVNADLRIEFPGDFLAKSTAWMPGPTVEAYNNTEAKWEVMGWRFRTKDVQWDNLTGDTKAKSSIVSDNGSYIHEAIVSRPDLRLMTPNGNNKISTFALAYNGKTVEAGKNGTPFDNSVLLKLYDKGVMPPPPIGELPITVEKIDSITSVSTYYDSDYRYLDTLGMRGGVTSGGFIDTWLGETQIQLPITNDTFELSQTPVVFAPTNAGGAIYWMALAMLQEYFSGDMQFQTAIGFKETMAGTSGPYESKMDNSDNAFGPYEVESYTYVTQALYYPELYPKYKAELLKYPDPTSFGSNVMPPADFASFYCGPKSGTLLNNPQIIGCLIGSHHVFKRIYDIYSNAENFCFKELLTKGKDNVIAVAAMAVAYNRGIDALDQGTNLTADSVFNINKFKDYMNDPQANKSLPMGNSEYREQVLKYSKVMTDANRKAFADHTISIYDEFITKDDLTKFFFGEGGSVSTQGSGGLCNHFVLSDRNVFWSDLNAAFDKLASHWSQATPSISYRYDWLTLLRSVKKYFPIKRAPRPVATEAATWMDKRSMPEDSCGCDGTLTDKSFPYVELRGSKTGSEFRAQFDCRDNYAVRDLMFTTDSLWRSWECGEKIAGVQENGVWQVSFAQSDGIVQGTPYWVCAVDSSGNAEVKRFSVKDSGVVSVAETKKHANHPLSIHFNGKDVFVQGGQKSVIYFRLYSLNGRSVMTKRSILTGATISVDFLPAGYYIAELKDNYGSVKRFTLIK